MRFFQGRWAGTTRRPPTAGCRELPKHRQTGSNANTALLVRDDRRGRHTKDDVLRRRALRLAAVERILNPTRGCGCDGDRHPLVVAEGYGVCTGCGLVDPELRVYDRVGTPSADTGAGLDQSLYAGHPLLWGVELPVASAPYRRENHLSELLKQATDTDPRIPKDDMQRIASEWIRSFRLEHPTEPLDPLGLSRWDIKQYIRPLGAHKCKKYSERWLQILRYLTGREYFDAYGPPLLPFELCHRIHARYRVFALMFERLKRDKHPLFQHRHNVPNLNTIVLHLLGQDSEENVERYGWYFTGLDTLQSRITTEIRIGCIIRHLERETFHDGFQWRYHHRLPPEDVELYLQDPKRFHSIIAQQVAQCQKPSKRSQEARDPSRSGTGPSPPDPMGSPRPGSPSSSTSTMAPPSLTWSDMPPLVGASVPSSLRP